MRRSGRAKEQKRNRFRRLSCLTLVLSQAALLAIIVYVVPSVRALTSQAGLPVERVPAAWIAAAGYLLRFWYVYVAVVVVLDALLFIKVRRPVVNVIAFPFFAAAGIEILLQVAGMVADWTHLRIAVDPYGPGQWYKANLHCHSTNSDGLVSPDEVVRSYKERGFQVLAITDHNYITPVEQYQTADFVCIPGYEWTSPTKHMTILEAKRVYPEGLLAWTGGQPFAPNDPETIQATLEDARAQRALVILAHPTTPGHEWTTSDGQRWIGMYVGIEAYGGGYWGQILVASKANVYGFYNDDNHFKEEQLSPNGVAFHKYNYIFSTELSRQEIMRSIKRGMSYATSGPTMNEEPLRIECDGIALPMGAGGTCRKSLIVRARVKAQPSYRTSKTAPLVQVRLFNNGNVIYEKTCNDASFYLYFDDMSLVESGYVRMDATDAENRRLLSNPIWITMDRLVK